MSQELYDKSMEILDFIIHNSSKKTYKDKNNQTVRAGDVLAKRKWFVAIKDCWIVKSYINYNGETDLEAIRIGGGIMKGLK